MQNNKIKLIQFTSESVSGGHPDKLCDQISDAVLDAYLSKDPEARVACETLAKDNCIILAGEITSSHNLSDGEYEEIVRRVMTEVGYSRAELGVDANTVKVINLLGKQSPDINQGVDRSAKEEQGAGDQGIMFGFAINDNSANMPLPLHFANSIVKNLDQCRRDLEAKGDFSLRPDAKSQVTINYNADTLTPYSLDTILVSVQHDENITQEELHTLVYDAVLKDLIEAMSFHFESKDFSNVNILINPTGKFVIGGPVGDCGVTGRKIAIDQYAGFCPIGGGAFSGKDPSKVDRSAAYMCRYVANNVVSAGLADQCTLNVSYAIGVAEPTSIYLDCKGTEKVALEVLEKAIRKIFSFSARACHDLTMADYGTTWKFQDTAAYGHFGRTDKAFPWERTDKVAELRQLCEFDKELTQVM